MTGILLLLALLIAGLAALYLVAVRPDLVASWLYRMLRGGDPWSWRERLRARLLTVQRPPVDPWHPTDIAEAEARYGDLYPPEAAEAPYDREPRCGLDPLDEHFNTAPRVIAGQDIDDSLLIAELQQAYADYRTGRDVYAGAIHEPSPEVKQ